MKPNQIVSREESLIARRTLLVKEKAYMRERTGSPPSGASFPA